MIPEVVSAIEEIREAFPETTVAAHDDGSGGAYVIVDSVDPGTQYEQRSTWIAFQITFQYPVADVYPHFVRHDLSRVDKAGLGEGMSLGSFGFDARPAIQVSRRSNRLNPATDTALIKLWKVLEWLASR